MIINQLMALLLPSVVSLKIYEKLEGEENRIQKLVKKYLKALLIVNVIVYAIVIYIVKQKDFVFTNQFTLKYIVLATTVSVIYPMIEKLIRAKAEMGIEVKAGDEKQD